VVVPPIPQEAVSRRLRRDAVKDLDEEAHLVDVVGEATRGLLGLGQPRRPSDRAAALPARHCNSGSCPCSSGDPRTGPSGRRTSARLRAMGSRGHPRAPFGRSPHPLRVIHSVRA
jgi:hypothetical protein